MNTIFRKQLILYLGILIISLGLIGITLSQVIRTYFIEQREETLRASSTFISASLEGYFQYGILDVIQLNREIINMQQFLDARLIVISNDFYPLIPSQDLVNYRQAMEHRDLTPLMTGYSIVSYGTLDGIYREPFLTVGHPIRVSDQVVGAVLVGTSVAELEAAINEIYRIIVLCIGLAALFGGILIYISSRAVSRPLLQMNEAASIIAGGDFEKRISVNSKDEVGQLSESFNHMAEGLQEQERVRRAFIANLSHDIRSPLTSMRGFLQAIEDGTVPEEKTPYYIGIVMDETDRLIKLANNLLDTNALNESPITYTNFDINGLIRRTVLSFEPRATEKNLQLHCRFAHESDRVKADYDKIQRVVYNLVDNATKFIQSGGEIIVETNVDEDFIYVSVQDNGPGIKQEDQAKVFERFFKADSSRNEDKKGSGLGLSIVNDIVRTHGGSVRLESEEGQGSMFVFSVPIER